MCYYKAKTRIYAAPAVKGLMWLSNTKPLWCRERTQVLCQWRFISDINGGRDLENLNHFLGLSQIFADAYFHHAPIVRPFLRLSATFSTITCFALL